MKVNKQKTTVQGCLELTEKQKTLCDSTSNHHSDSSSPLTTIPTNTCNSSMDDFILNKPVSRIRHKHRETLNILGIDENNLNSIKHSVCNNSDKIEKAEISEAQHSEISTFAQTLSSSKVEQMTCHKELKENGVPFCSTPMDNDNGCTQKRLEQQINNLDNLSQSSSQSVAYPVNQTSALLLAPESENQGPCLSIAKEKKNILSFQRPIKKYLVMTSMSSR